MHTHKGNYMLNEEIEDIKKREILRKVLSVYDFDCSKIQDTIIALQSYRKSYKLTKREKPLINQMITSGNIPKIDLETAYELKGVVEKKAVVIIKKKEVGKNIMNIFLDNVLIIGAEQGEFCQFSENIKVGFDMLGKRTAYISPSDLHHYKLPKPNTTHYPLSAVLQQVPFIPDLIIIDECNFLFKNDVKHIPVFYYHREFKRPPSVDYPDLVFFFHSCIRRYFKDMMAPKWMSNVKYQKIIPLGVNEDIYQPKEKIYKGVCGIGFRESAQYAERVNEITTVPISRIMHSEWEAFKKLGFRFFDTPITNKQYRELLPQCEAIWISPAPQQYLTHKMYEAMACKTLCVVKFDSMEHERTLRNAGFINGVHYIGVWGMEDIRKVYSETLNKPKIVEAAYKKIMSENTYTPIAKHISELYHELAPKILLGYTADYKNDPGDLNVILSSVEKVGVSWVCYFIAMIYGVMYGKKKVWNERVSRLAASNPDYTTPKGWNTVEYVPIKDLIKKPYDKIILLQRKLDSEKEAMLYYYYNSQLYVLPETVKPTLDYKKDKENPEYADWFERIEAYYDRVYAEVDDKRVLRIYLEDLNNYTVSTFNEILDFLEFKKEDRPFLIPVNTPERVWGAFSSVYQKGDLINDRLVGIHKNFSNSEIDFDRKSSSKEDIVPARDLVMCDGAVCGNLTPIEMEIQRKRNFTLNPFADNVDTLNILNNNSVDIICPIYWINNSLFLDNVKSWIEEIPTNRIIFGMNNKDIELKGKWLKKIKKIAPRLTIQIVDQTHLKTLGMCLSDLMKRVETPWFVFVHSDVRLLPDTFACMARHTQLECGIIESERIFYNGKTSTYGKTHQVERAYSGFQLIQKESIANLLDEIEDDFIYRNEDLIFQSRCMENGYKYVKVRAYHIHQIINSKWTVSEKETDFMQWKGLVKYTQPNKINRYPGSVPAMTCIKKHNYTLGQILAFTWEFNPNWGETMIEKYNEWKKLGELK